MGQTLSIPNRVGTVHNYGANSAAGGASGTGSFKPYDPSKVQGDSTPNLPAPQAEDGGCGGLGQILIIIVAIVVTVVTYGAAAQAGASLIVAGAVGGAAGAIASQAVAIAIGLQDDFNWKGVALAAIGGAIGGGLSTYAPLGGAVNSTANVIVRAAVGNAMTQGVAVATGLQAKFDWKGVAIAAVGAGLGSAVSEGLGDSVMRDDDGNAFLDAKGNFERWKGSGVMAELGRSGDIIRSSLSGAAAGITAASMRGGRVDITRIASDAFGNALGNSWGEQINASVQEGKLREVSAGQQGTGPYSANDYRNGMDMDSDNYNPSQAWGTSQSIDRSGFSRTNALMADSSNPSFVMDLPPSDEELNANGERPGLVAGPGVAKSGPGIRARSQALMTQYLDAAYLPEGQERLRAQHESLLGIRQLLGEYDSNPKYLQDELANMQQMASGGKGLVGQRFGGTSADQPYSMIEVAAGSVLNQNALGLGSIMMPLTSNEFSFRRNGDAMGGFMALLSMADRDGVIDGLRDIGNQEVNAFGRPMNALQFAGTRESAGSVMMMLGTSPALAAGQFARGVATSKAMAAEAWVQGAANRYLSQVDVRGSSFLADQALSVGSSVRVLPKNWQGPSAGTGRFVGEKGNSEFVLSSSAAKELNLPQGTTVRFVNGTPDFGPQTIKTPAGTSGSFSVEELTYSRGNDATATVRHLANESNMTPSQVRAWLREQDVRMHHFQGNVMQLVPTRLHQVVHHTGSVGMSGK